MPPRVRVIGLGNPLRGDDGAGLLVAQELAGLARPGHVAVEAYEGEGVGLLSLWEGADAVWLLDALHGDGPAGVIRRFDAGARPLPVSTRSASTHATTVADGIELARALGRLPRRIVLYGIEGEAFGTGEPMSVAVREAVPKVVRTVRAEVSAALAGSC
ncbi:MAG TPA: hydrogenase maturation protease [Solirubrobacteraceae bacterium]